MAPPKQILDAHRLTLAVKAAQYDALVREAAQQGVSLSELVRRLLDEWMRRGTGRA